MADGSNGMPSLRAMPLPKKKTSVNINYAAQNGKVISAPTEVWVAAMVSCMSEQLKQVVFKKVEEINAQRIGTPNMLSSLKRPIGG